MLNTHNTSTIKRVSVSLKTELTTFKNFRQTDRDNKIKTILDTLQRTAAAEQQQRKFTLKLTKPTRSVLPFSLRIVMSFGWFLSAWFVESEPIKKTTSSKELLCTVK